MAMLVNRKMNVLIIEKQAGFLSNSDFLIELESSGSETSVFHRALRFYDFAWFYIAR